MGFWKNRLLFLWVSSLTNENLKLFYNCLFIYRYVMYAVGMIQIYMMTAISIERLNKPLFEMIRNKWF